RTGPAPSVGWAKPDRHAGGAGALSLPRSRGAVPSGGPRAGIEPVRRPGMMADHGLHGAGAGSMAGKNLTRDEARERARLITVDTYRIELDLSGAKASGAETFRSASTIRFTHASPGPDASTFLDL